MKDETTVICGKQLCPNCLKKNLLEKGKEAWCDNCGQEFDIVGYLTVRYKK
jgi:hypothetical protein